MNNQKLILFFVFIFSTFMLFDAWQRDQKPNTSVASVAIAGKSSPASSNAEIPTPQKDVSNSNTQSAPVGLVPASNNESKISAIQNGGETIKVETDILLAEISTMGGDIRHLEFKNHKGTDDKSKNFVLFRSGGNELYVSQSGLIGKDLPNHRARYTSQSLVYRLTNDQKTLEIKLESPESNGIKVNQVYKFSRGSYVIDVGYEIENNSTQAFQPHAYFQLVRDKTPPEGESAMLPTYTGLAVYTQQDKFKKVSFKDVDGDKLSFNKSIIDHGWVAIIQHYFVSAFLPPEKMRREFYTKKLGPELYSAGTILTGQTIEPGKKAFIGSPLYAGPSDSKLLEKLAPGFELVVDFGILTVIAVPLFMVLTWIHGWVGNWGIAIILLTVLLKAMFFPLQQASYRAMAKMKKITPKMQQIKERYADDRQRQQKAIMELYQKEKVNPMAGCLPILVQMPVFISLYWTILAAVELRHAPFYGWITDLSAKDPFYILPILMGASMIIQTKLNPEPPDPLQAKMMKIMPIAFSIFFFFFPSGLVLYWLVNNVLSILQQWQINRVLDQENESPGAKA